MKWIRIGASVDPGEKLPNERDGDGLRKIRIKFSLIKKTNMGVAYAWAFPDCARKILKKCWQKWLKSAQNLKIVLKKC